MQADGAFLVAHLAEVILEDDERGLGRVAETPVFALDEDAVAERAGAAVAGARVDAADGDAGPAFDDKEELVRLELPERQLFRVFRDSREGDRRPSEVQLARRLAVEVPAREGFGVRRLDAAQADEFALPEVHPLIAECGIRIAE